MNQAEESVSGLGDVFELFQSSFQSTSSGALDSSCGPDLKLCFPQSVTWFSLLTFLYCIPELSLLSSP